LPGLLSTLLGLPSLHLGELAGGFCLGAGLLCDTSLFAGAGLCLAFPLCGIRGVENKGGYATGENEKAAKGDQGTGIIRSRAGSFQAPTQIFSNQWGGGRRHAALISA
jgi:hypothetical protein